MDNNKKNNEDNDKIDPNGAEKYRVQGEKHAVSNRGSPMDIGTGTGTGEGTGTGTGTGEGTGTGTGTGMGMKWEGSQRVYLDYTGLLDLDSIVDFVGKKNH